MLYFNFFYFQILAETCEAIDDLDVNIIQSPPGCLTNFTGGTYGDNCTLSCPAGYQLRGPSSIYYCNDRGLWSVSRNSNPSPIPFIPFRNPFRDIGLDDQFSSEETRCQGKYY